MDCQGDESRTSYPLYGARDRIEQARPALNEMHKAFAEQYGEDRHAAKSDRHPYHHRAGKQQTGHRYAAYDRERHDEQGKRARNQSRHHADHLALVFVVMAVAQGAPNHPGAYQARRPRLMSSSSGARPTLPSAIETNGSERTAISTAIVTWVKESVSETNSPRATFASDPAR